MPLSQPSALRRAGDDCRTGRQKWRVCLWAIVAGRRALRQRLRTRPSQLRKARSWPLAGNGHLARVRAREGRRKAYGPRTTLLLWILCECAIIACDLAELFGAAVALKLLFGLPLIWGVLLMGIQVLLLLGLQRRSIRPLEILIFSLLLLIGLCFVVELSLARPPVASILGG